MEKTESSKSLDIVKRLPTLYGVSSSGKYKLWEISVVGKDDGVSPAVIITKHGYIGQTISEKHKEIKKGKNIGKSNETTPFQQAVNEATSSWQSKVDEEYRDSIEALKQASESQVIYLPMLAHPYESRKHYITYPCYIQPKLNGVRAISSSVSNDRIITSRQGKVYKALIEIQEVISRLPKSVITDGEIYNHGDLTFQELISAIKNEEEREDNVHLLKYYLYDLPSCTGGFKKRYSELIKIVDELDSDLIEIVETVECNSFEELMYWHSKWCADGYEGTMIRNFEGEYTFKHRSNNLLKYKDFIDEEFVIVGGEEGVGLASGQCTFTCITPEGGRFNVRSRGPNSLREEYWVNLKNYIGKKLTVRFQCYSDDKIPIFPVGIAIRDYE